MKFACRILSKTAKCHFVTREDCSIDTNNHKKSQVACHITVYRNTITAIKRTIQAQPTIRYVRHWQHFTKHLQIPELVSPPSLHKKTQWGSSTLHHIHAMAFHSIMAAILVAQKTNVHHTMWRKNLSCGCTLMRETFFCTHVFKILEKT